MAPEQLERIVNVSNKRDPQLAVREVERALANSPNAERLRLDFHRNVFGSKRRGQRASIRFFATLYRIRVEQEAIDRVKATLASRDGRSLRTAVKTPRWMR